MCYFSLTGSYSQLYYEKKKNVTKISIEPLILRPRVSFMCVSKRIHNISFGFCSEINYFVHLEMYSHSDGEETPRVPILLHRAVTYTAANEICIP